MASFEGDYSVSAGGGGIDSIKSDYSAGDGGGGDLNQIHSEYSVSGGGGGDTNPIKNEYSVSAGSSGGDIGSIKSDYSVSASGSGAGDTNSIKSEYSVSSGVGGGSSVDNGSKAQSQSQPEPPKSAFMCFSAWKHKEMEKRGEIVAKKVAIQHVAEAWRMLSANDRAYWDEEARNDKLRFVKEKAAYKGPWEIPKRRAKKHPLAPKRPMSAFLKFSQTRRAVVKKDNPDMSNTDVSRLLGEMWRNANPKERAPYVEQEEKERAVYKAEIAKWRAEQARIESSQRLSRQTQEYDAQKDANHQPSQPYSYPAEPLRHHDGNSGYSGYHPYNGYGYYGHYNSGPYYGDGKDRSSSSSYQHYPAAESRPATSSALATTTTSQSNEDSHAANEYENPHSTSTNEYSMPPPLPPPQMKEEGDFEPPTSRGFYAKFT